MDAPPSDAQLEAMSELIAHRGPDDAGVYLDARAALAHRRLAIVDPDRGAQPAFGARKRLVVVYNGEVYNHGALRDELGAAGHTFETRCDTEAIVRAHEHWGAGAAARLRGMFAYAAWDRDARTLVLARDPLGVKPLYYAALPSGDLLFASELKPLLVEPRVDRAIDEDALACYLALRYVPAPATILRGVRKLPPGATLTWRDGRVSVERYWSVPVDPRPAPPTWAEAGGRLCQVLDEVVDQCRMADVPLGALLSGGLDSTLVAALLAKFARRDGAPAPHTYSVGYAGSGAARTDERRWARLASTRLGTRHHEVEIGARDVIDRIAEIARSLDEPLGDPSSIPMWFVARRARDDVKVVLSGEGADEIFAGYALYAFVRRARATSIARIAGRLALGWFRAGPIHRRALLASAPLEQAWRGPSRAFDRPPWGDGDAVRRALAPAWSHARRAPTLLGRLLAFDQQVWLPDDVLLKSDRMTMAHSLELRPPLVDHHLLDEVASWPDEWKLRRGVGKAILRHAAEGLVPPEILGREKRGFSTPSAEWLRGPLRELARGLLVGDASLAAERGERSRIAGLIDDHARGLDRADELWSLLSLELWRREVLMRARVVEGAPVAQAG